MCAGHGGPGEVERGGVRRDVPKGGWAAWGANRRACVVTRAGRTAAWQRAGQGEHGGKGNIGEQLQGFLLTGWVRGRLRGGEVRP